MANRNASGSKRDSREQSVRLSDLRRQVGRIARTRGGEFDEQSDVVQRERTTSDVVPVVRGEEITAMTPSGFAVDVSLEEWATDETGMRVRADRRGDAPAELLALDIIDTPDDAWEIHDAQIPSWRTLTGLSAPFSEDFDIELDAAVHSDLEDEAYRRELKTERELRPMPSRTSRSEPPPLPRSVDRGAATWSAGERQTPRARSVGAEVSIPPAPPLPRFPMDTHGENLSKYVPASWAPSAASSISPVALPTPTLPPLRGTVSRIRGVSPWMPGAVGALAAAAAAVALLWNPHNTDSARTLAAQVRSTPPAFVSDIVHQIPTVVIESDGLASLAAGTQLAGGQGGFDTEAAATLVKDAATKAHKCGLRGVDSTADVTFEPSGAVSFVAVTGDHALPWLATHCADEAYFNLRTSPFQGAAQTIHVRVNGTTGQAAVVTKDQSL